MTYLKINKEGAFFENKKGAYVKIDEIGKDDLIFLISKAMDPTIEFEMDDPENEDHKIPNEAQKIIYENIYGKLQELIKGKTSFLDEVSKLYKEAYQKYAIETIENNDIESFRFPGQ